MRRRLLLIAAWIVLGFIIVVTLSPIDLRPGTGLVIPERFVAYSLLGAVAMCAYPQRFKSVAAFILAVASSLELLQHVTPDRHGNLTDVAEKIGGGLAGCGLMRLIQILRSHSRE